MNATATRIDPRGSARRSPTAGNRGQGGKWLHPTTRRRIYERDGYCCVWCDREVLVLAIGGFIGQASIDHVVPRSRGGSNRSANLITACAGCNAARGHRSVPAFAAMLEFKPTACEHRALGAKVIIRRVRNAQRRKLPVISRTP